MLLKDSKFLWLVAAAVIVSFLEFFSLAGIQLPQSIALPFFLILIILVGYRTLYHGLQALLQLNFKSINLLMLIACTGAFYLQRYEEACVVIVLYTLAERLEDIGIAKSRSALDILLNKIPKKITVINKGLVDVKEIVLGDVMTVKPGEMIPLDGIVTKGSSSIDESPITGEPIPQDKHVEDLVFAGTLNLQGYLEILVTQLSQNTTLAKIKELTLQATRNKAKTQKFIEKFSSYYTPFVIFLALGLALIPPLIFHQNFNFWFLEALTLLVIACPCALVISTPISIYSAVGNASKKGVLIKGGKYLEALGEVKAVAFDKTRTLTEGKPHVTDIISFGSTSQEDLLSCAAGIAQFSEHPLSQSIVEAASQKNVTLHEAENFQAIVGKGMKADCLVCENSHHCVGKLKFILEEHPVPRLILDEVDLLQKEGKTVIVVSTHHEIEGIIALVDTLRPESPSVIKKLESMGIATIMLTGDHATPAKNAAERLGIQDVRSELLPQDKAQAIEDLLRKYRTVAMVGDGVNDAPALAGSSVGITLSSLGSDTAIEAASIVLLNDHLSVIPDMIKLGRRTLRIIRFNTFWAIMVKFVFITLALSGLNNLALAIFADVGMTLLVILNSLRLLK